MKNIRQYAAMLAIASGLMLAPNTASAQRKQDIIKKEDIANSAQKDGNLYDLIRNMRPHMLEKPRATKSIGGRIPPLMVIVDGVKETEVESLSRIVASTVEEVRYYDTQKAQDEFGMLAGGGAIVVKMSKGAAAPATVRDTTKPPTA